MFRLFVPALAALALAALASACSPAPAKKPVRSPDANRAAPVEAPAPELGARVANEPLSGLPVELDDMRVGRDDAQVTMVAFLDFECPYCQRGFETVEELRQAYKPEQLRIVLKHMPLGFHKDAWPAALAAQAVVLAAGPGAGYEFAQELFEERDLSNTGLFEAAKRLGVDRELYSELLEDEETAERVKRDQSLGQSRGVTGTPAFFINGHLFAGALPFEDFQRKIDEELEHYRTRSAQGASWQQIYGERIETNLELSLAQAVLGEDDAVYRVPVDGSPSLGAPDALVTMVMFSDFECPYCKRADATVAELKAHYGAKLRLVWKHLPLPFHARARPAARLAALIQELKGDEAFFAFAAKVFAASPALDEATLLRLSGEAGIPADQAANAISGQIPSVEARLERDSLLADDLGTRGTPNFYINGRHVTGARPFEHFEAVIRMVEEEAAARVAEGVKPAELYESLVREGVTPGVAEEVELPDLQEKNRPTLGPKNAPLVLHVFSDFECPFCRRVEPTLAELRERHKGEIRWVWHDLPLVFHKRALPAARAGREAFRQQGHQAFWRMHDLLFGLEVSTSLVSDEDIEAHALALNLRKTELAAALGGARDDTIEEDRAIADGLGIRGTPAFVLTRAGEGRGVIISGAQPIEKFERTIARLLQGRPSEAAPK